MGFFQRNQKFLIWAVVIIIIPAFGVSGLLVALSGRSSNQSYGMLNGKNITVKMLQAHMARHGITSRYATVPQIIASYIQTENAKESGFKVSDREVIAYVKDNPIFKNDNGLYDAAKFKKYLESSKVSRDVLFEGMREKLLAEKARDGGERGLLRQPAPISNKEILFQFHRDKDQYKVKYAMFPVKDLEEGQAPTYDRIKSIYTQARGYLEAGDLEDEEFFRNFPIQDKILKQWVIVEYLSIDKMAIQEALEVDEFMVLEYYNKNKQRYIIEEEEETSEEAAGEAPPEDTEKNEPEEPKEPRYRPLEDVSKLIEGILVDKEANEVMDLIKRKVESRRIEAENRDEQLTLKELARHNFFKEVEVKEGYIKDTSKKIVRFNLSDPIELPNFMNARDGLKIDPKLGKLPADYQYLYSLMQRQPPPINSDFARAAIALQDPEPDIATQFLKFPKGYCLFVPVWWPNKDVASETRRADLRDYIDFPTKATVGLEEEPAAEDQPELTLLDLKLKNTRLKAQIELYNEIKTKLADKTKKDATRKLAENLRAQVSFDTFDAIAIKEGAELKTEVSQSIRDGGAPVEACYQLVAGREISEVFTTRKREEGKDQEFFCVGILLGTKPADDKSIPQEDIDKIKKSLRRERETEYIDLMNIATTPDWRPREQ